MVEPPRTHVKLPYGQCSLCSTVVQRGSETLNHPTQVKLPYGQCSLCSTVVRRGSVGLNLPELM